MSVVRAGVFVLSATGLLLGSFAAEASAQPKPDELAARAQEIMRTYWCFRCHGDNPQNLRKNLNLLDRAQLLKVVTPKEPKDSLLMQRIEKGSMPASQVLSRVTRAEQQVLLEWIAAGAPAFPEKSREEAANKDKESLKTSVTEILRTSCARCHGGDHPRGGFRIFDYDKLIARKVVIPNDPDNSPLFKRLTAEDDEIMPPAGKGRTPLAKDKIQLVKRWIQEGAPQLEDKPPSSSAVAIAVNIPEKPQPRKEAEPVQATAVLRKHCVSCHGGSKPESGLRVFDLNKLLHDKLVVPNDPDHSPLFRRVTAKDSTAMPPPGGNRPRLDAEEIKAVRTWIQEGAQPLEKMIAPPVGKVGDEYIVQAILDDVRKLKKDNELIERYRYFSLNHLLSSGITPEQLELHRQALTLVMNHLSREASLVLPEPIEDTKTVYRVDIGKLGWDRTPFQQIDKNGKETGKGSLTLFDLILLEYPYGNFLGASATFQQLVDEFLTPTNQVAPVPYVRADWFINVPSRPPLYEDLLQLPFTLDKLENSLDVDTKDNLREFKALRGGVKLSGVSNNNRLLERHPGTTRTSYYWKSFDFNSNRQGQDISRNPLDFTHAGGEMIWGLPNGLQAYALMTAKGSRLEAAPSAIVTDPHAADKVVRNGLACMRCHAAGMQTFKDVVRPALDRLGKAEFDLIGARRLYAGQTAIDRELARDQQRFLAAVRQLGIPREASITRILKETSDRYLDEQVRAQTVLAELPDPARTAPDFTGRRLEVLGLAPLALAGGTIHRDTWEDAYDQVLLETNQGTPLVPLDGLRRTEYQRQEDVDVEIETRDARTKKKRITFTPGDQAVVVVKNKSKKDFFIELIGNGSQGFKKILFEAGTVLPAGKELQFPPAGQDPITVEENLGKESITLFASEKKFPAGEILRLSDADEKQGKGMADRIVHRFYKLERKGRDMSLSFDPASVVKKTIEISTE